VLREFEIRCSTFAGAVQAVFEIWQPRRERPENGMERKRGPAVTRRTALAGACRANIDEESVSPALAAGTWDLACRDRAERFRRSSVGAGRKKLSCSHLRHHRLLYTFTAFD
jgi:hypothetical protein